jgi:alpha-1,2-mannosyltransferase
MSQIFEPVMPQTKARPVSSALATIRIALWAFLPILAIGLLGWQHADALRAIIPIDLTNFDAIRKMLSSFIRPADHGDSWLPMKHALEVLRGPDRDRLYETLFLGAHIRFQYPPSSLLPLEFLSAVGLSSVRALNAINSLVFLLNACAVGALSWLLFRNKSHAQTNAPQGTAMAILAAGAAFIFYPLIRAQLLGQIQLWIDLLFTLALLCWFLERRLLAGLLVGLACTIKPQMGLLLLWCLLWREWRFAAGILIAAIPILLASLYRYGFHNHIAYLDVLSFLSRHGESFFANNSVNGILNWYLSPNDSLRWYDNDLTPFNPIVYAGTMVASVLALGLVCAPPLLHRSRRPALSDLGAAAICTVAGSPVAWEHHYGILLPLYLVALHTLFTMADGYRRRLAAAGLTISWILVADFIPFAGFLAHTPFAIVQAYCFFGALLLLVFFLTAGNATPNQPVGRSQ